MELKWRIQNNNNTDRELPIVKYSNTRRGKTVAHKKTKVKHALPILYEGEKYFHLEKGRMYAMVLKKDYEVI